MALKLKSSAYENGDPIPSRYTCDGEDISPPLEWSNIPQGTVTFTIIFDDPDAPSKTWVHWLLFNIPGDERKIDPHVPASDILANGAIHGTNDFNKLAYGGPCPPGGTHRYIMKLYALDIELDLSPGAIKEELLEAMDGHVIEQVELIGEYTRK